MTPDEVKYRLKALKWLVIGIDYLQKKIVECDKEIQERKRQGEGYPTDLLEMRIDISKDSLQNKKLAEERILLFIKTYTDSEDDYNLLVRHYRNDESYAEIADSMFYSERTIHKKFKKAIDALVENAKDVEPFPY